MKKLQLLDVIESMTDSNSLVSFAEQISKIDSPELKRWSNELMQKAVINSQTYQEIDFAVESHVKGNCFIDNELAKKFYDLAFEKVDEIEEENYLIYLISKDTRIDDSCWFQDVLNRTIEKAEHDWDRADTFTSASTCEILNDDVWKQQFLTNTLKMINDENELAYIAKQINRQKCPETKRFLADIFETVTGHIPIYYLENLASNTELVTSAA